MGSGQEVKGARLVAKSSGTVGKRTRCDKSEVSVSVGAEGGVGIEVVVIIQKHTINDLKHIVNMEAEYLARYAENAS